ncbi:DUF6443 domain-containing protein [Chryseobacterium sp. ON_d1]|uniref:DUF6443 domain-containing protein n=1 Tax=Chryseobacterium sp. ON_d1 TaxID=2583211 RepID=UPI001167156C|nr:DUF6443 domain-containing protein [Chryseobacterium sp. ON_d1]GEJ43567.1 cell wall-associated protein [Chryseobacterium sp. ON_d1]
MKGIILSIITLLVSTFSLAQTTTENFIQTKTYLEPVKDSSLTAKQSRIIEYFDGLGKTKQIINVKSTPLGKDLVTIIPYDDFGRQVDNWLPVPLNSLGGAIQDGIQGAVQTYHNDSRPFSHTNLETSPLDRTLSQVRPGTIWQTHPVQFKYEANEDGEVKKYISSTNWVNNETSSDVIESGFYPAGKLYKNSVIDEDENKTIEYKNSKGQVILIKKIISPTESANTYYVYNEYDQLVFVIPPKASIVADVNSVLSQLCYQYKYDNKNRLIEKQLPGKGKEYMVYDKADRLILYQDTNLKEKQNKWLITKYDQLGRVAYTGFLNGGDRIDRQNDINNLVITETRSTTGFTSNGITVYYTQNYFNNEIPTILSVNYYDVYPQYDFNPTFPADILGQPTLTEAIDNKGFSTIGLPVMNLVKNIEDDNWTKKYIYYNKKGQLIRSYSINHLGGRTQIDSKLDFTGAVQQTVTWHKRLNADPDKVITENFTYDHQNRLLTHTHQVDNNSVEYLAQNKYDELSQIESKKVGGTSPNAPLQQINYQYNIRGWMTKINDPSNLGGKLFGYEMKFTNPVNSNIAPGKFNSNITEIDWKISSEDVLKRYNYEYDNLNRLKNAFYKEPTTGNNNFFDEYMTYDLNGNIETLKRTAPLVFSPTATTVDDLEYKYTGNRLTKVIENALNDAGYEGGNNIIDYDPNGNMTTMKDKGIYEIDYNYINLPSTFSITQNDPFGTSISFFLNYLYRADGTKVRKTYTTGGGKGQPTVNKMTDYLDGFQYNGTESIAPCPWCRTEFAYEEQAFKGPILDPEITKGWTLGFVSTAEGFYSFTEKRYIYQYRDHLGNVRVSYAKNNEGAVEITGTNNYYAFGANHIGGVKSLLGGYQNYKYNGKELQESGMYDYGARFYMADLGRWGVVDPLAESYRRHSPYNYTVNNPINFTDPDGRWVRGAGFWNNLTKSDARIYAEQWSEKLGSGFYNVAVNKGDNGTWKVSSHTLNVSYTDSFNSKGYINTLAVGYSEGGGLGTRPSAINPWGPTIGSVPESRGKSDIQMLVSENPLVQGAAIDLLTAGTGKVIRGLLQSEKEAVRVGHLTPWAEMVKEERRAFQHSYKKAAELDLPVWHEKEADILQELFNNKVSNIREAGANSFFKSNEWVRGVRTTVNRTEPIIGGEKYYYYETIQGKFVSAGKMP